MTYGEFTNKCDLRSQRMFLANKNILFADPKKGIINPPSKLNLIAIREISKEKEKV